MRYIRLFYMIMSVIIYSGCAVDTQNRIQELLQHSGTDKLPEQEIYDDYGAVFLYENIETNIYFDETWMASKQYSYHSAIRYFNSKAEQYLSPVIYLSNKDELTSFFARTIKSYGETIELNMKDLHPVQVKPEYVDFTDNKSLKFTFAGVEPGCIIEYGYKTNNKRRLLHDQIWIIQDEIPKLYSRFSIEFPRHILNEGYGWTFLTVNINLEPPNTKGSLRSSGIFDYNTEIYYWELKDIPAMVYEPQMPPYDDVAQYLRVDFKYKNWDELSKKY